jgi:hypothetical protein
MIVVQELQTRWTKASRGAPTASARDGTPRALRVPDADCIPLQNLILHRLRFDESDSFAPSVPQAPRHTSLQHPVSCVAVREEGDSRITVAFNWDPLTCGAPRRSHGTPIHLKRGDWCQILFNGRHGSDREWSYHSTIVNVAHLSQANASIFLDSPPALVSNHLAELW